MFDFIRRRSVDDNVPRSAADGCPRGPSRIVVSSRNLWHNFLSAAPDCPHRSKVYRRCDSQVRPRTGSSPACDKCVSLPASQVLADDCLANHVSSLETGVHFGVLLTGSRRSNQCPVEEKRQAARLHAGPGHLNPLVSPGGNSELCSRTTCSILRRLHSKSGYGPTNWNGAQLPQSRCRVTGFRICLRTGLKLWSGWPAV